MFFFFRVNFMELKLFGLLSFGFSFGSWLVVYMESADGGFSRV